MTIRMVFNVGPKVLMAVVVEDEDWETAIYGVFYDSKEVRYVLASPELY